MKTPTRALPNRHRRPSLLPRRGAIAAVLSVMLGASALGVVGPAQALTRAGVGPDDPSGRQFPTYYTDDAGVALQMCDDGTAACLATTQAQLAPSDGEAFYWMATADMSSPGLDISIEFAAEAAWLGNQQITFDRLRIRGHAARAGTYTLIHPYGTTTVEASDPANAKNINLTEDVGCDPLPTCDFGAMTDSPNSHITSWITSTKLTPGRVGDGVTAGPATVGGAPASLTLTGPAGVASTSDFVVMGKKANPNEVSVPRLLDFGNVRATRTRNVKLVNLGTADRTISAVTLAGPTTLRKVATSNSCAAGKVLAPGRACLVGVKYVPDGRKSSAGTVRITDDVAVRSTRVTATSAATLAAPRQVTFDARRAGTSSGTRRIVVTNRGAVPMKVRSIVLEGRNAGSFERRSGSPKICARGVVVSAGRTCAIYVGFAPPKFGAKVARFVVRSNAVNPVQTIALSGRAR